ncbi:hypothetical protein ACHAXT_010244 [Thalassiosira profunda]
MAEDNIDWSGHAAPVSRKKHLPQPPSNVANHDVGVGPVKEESWKPGRKVAEGPKTSSSESLLGGPVPEGDPSVVEPSAWQTEAQSASVQTKTSRDQMTEAGRSRSCPGKAIVRPAHELARPFDETVGARLREQNPYALNDGNTAASATGSKKSPSTTASADSNNSLVGYRSGCGARSFLEGLGSEVAASMYSSTEPDTE